ncbi:MAG TPA: hypothetical protein DCZ84_01765 [Candidatus Vogelbacteria bacterium]|uniref:histidine kinase n=1 Tax=Candidatus Vogelbacteria bacterium RIFOXYD1_FULL_51_18 TaxID=1802440 RepID=A0A1G2QK54_9BACT|nr:MAG: Sensor protein resE [Parcubacteria group bacterium GW2011_GWC1_51_35]KKW25146.1 MAG: Sensor protein resE [Parcubacteria group bacterium GW2011_GWF2_52_12]OHA60331.1 MAG: hypothetical protein A2569_02420 [Candidatus Vogelbacteria bacterium RIFOXYD1_FULL_51_18]HBB65350.1 hypothetical protein [Candidatus Vogelbacteria bacterium]HCQ92191.1 hypothetical protein [Candidatus Vogelbacteria bacterium]
MATYEEKHLTDINKELYKRNRELAVKNKTLSLLRELYQISILTLEPAALSKRIVSTIQLALGFELVGIYTYQAAHDALEPLSFASSQNFSDARISLHCNFDNIAIEHTINSSFFKPIVRDQHTGHTSHLCEIWDKEIDKETLQKLQDQSHIVTTLVFPLSIEERVLGVIVLCLNREYDSLDEFEKEAITSFINVIAVALDKSILYQQIQAANLKLKELDKQKTEFVSIASHQLRSPLTAIKGYSSMMLEGTYGELGEKIKQPIQNIYDSSQRLVTIIEDFLNITRIELGRMKYEFVTLNFKELAEKVVNDQQSAAKQKGVVLNYHAEGGKYTINADPGKINQVISNLIDNAIKYTPAGAVDVTVNDGKGVVRLAVKDSGVGIPAEVMSKLFEKFVRADDAGKINYAGTGLGLYVAKQMVEAHKGKIWAESEGAGKGSTFIVELPAKKG